METDSLAGSPTEPSPLASGRVPLAFWSMVLRVISKRNHWDAKGRMWPLHSATRRKDTHVSAIDKTSNAFSHQGRRAGGNMETGIYGVSLGHSASVNASASVPFSQLRCQPRQNRGEGVSPEKAGLTCVWIC
jgi:hypothetical protein